MPPLPGQPAIPGAPPGLPGPGSTPAGPLPRAPIMPGNPMGGPGGPGGSPMANAGQGQGSERAADALIAGIMPTLLKAMQAYPLGSKKHQAALNAYRALTPNFGKQEDQQLVPAAIQQLAMNAKPGGPLAGARPAGLMPAPPPGPLPGAPAAGGPGEGLPGE